MKIQSLLDMVPPFLSVLAVSSFTIPAVAQENSSQKRVELLPGESDPALSNIQLEQSTSNNSSTTILSANNLPIIHKSIPEQPPLEWSQLQKSGLFDQGTLSSNSFLEKVTSVSQLSDVQASDWAYQALTSLVEKYGCVVGYPDNFYRGNQSLSRYEFAAGLNACINQINELIKNQTENLTSQQDLATLRQLQEQFATELAPLQERVDSLETRASRVEASQFSTTTKLVGEVIFAVTDEVGSSNSSQTVFQDKVRLSFNTSFTGRDLLQTRLQAGNANLFTLNGNSLTEGNQTFNVGSNGNSFVLDKLLYYLPLGNQLSITFAANAGTFDDFTPTLNPYLEDFDGGGGSLSTFAQRNAIYRLGGGQGIGIRSKFGDILELTLGYLANQGNSPNSGAGLLNGRYAALAQLTFNPSKEIEFGLTYLNSYFAGREFQFDNGTSINSLVGTNTANSIDTAFNAPVIVNSYGIQASFRLNSAFLINGWFGFTSARLIGVGDAEIWNYALGFAFPDLGGSGNLGGIIVGRGPYLGSASDSAPINRATSIHIEGFYKLRLTDNIFLTPGVIWITSPDQDAKNSDAVVLTLRTTFLF